MVNSKFLIKQLVLMESIQGGQKKHKNLKIYCSRAMDNDVDLNGT